MHQENRNFTKHFQVPFRAHEQRQNSQHQSTIECLYLICVSNMQDRHIFLYLSTGNTVKRRIVTKTPRRQNLINLVHTSAETDAIEE
jgi:hypothetical protein